MSSMNGNQLFYNDQYEKTLVKLNFGEEMMKIRIERGDIPIKGDICVKAKMQSQYQNENVPPVIEIIFDPNTTITEMKVQICQLASLDPENHRVYMTDWTG